VLVDLFATRTLEDPTTPLTGAQLATYLGSTLTANTGASINTTTAMRVSAVFACVRVIAETVASLPLILYQRVGESGKERARSHPLYGLLHDQPNPRMTAMELRENLAGHVCLWGSGYAEVVRDGAGRVRELWPLRPDRMDLAYEGTKPVWNYSMVDGTQVRLAYDAVWRVRGFGIDEYSGYSVIGQAREAIGAALATEEFAATYFANGSRPGGVLKHPGKLSKGAGTNLKSSWEGAHKGLDYAHRVAILEEGMEWQQIGLPPEDSQFLETRQFQVREIARMFRMQPHMIQDLGDATFSNIEHQGIEFVVHTIRPWLVRFEQSIYRDLLSEAERQRHFAEHLVDGLLRGDIKSRYEAYATGRQNGWLSADDIRELENMNPLPDGQGQMYLVPVNMTPADQVGQEEEEPLPAALPAQVGEDEPEDDEEREGRAGGQELSRRHSQARDDEGPVVEVGSARTRWLIAQAYQRLVADACRRVLNREEADVMRKARKLLAQGDVVGFVSWMRQFYQDHEPFFQECMGPPLTSLAEQAVRDAYAEIGQEGELTPDLEGFVQEIVESASQGYAGGQFGQLEALVDEAGGDPDLALELLQTRFDEWAEGTPGKQATWETTRVSNAITKAAWIAGGVVMLTWVTNGENCPYCNALEGKTVEINSWFLEEGDEFRPEGTEKAMTFYTNIGHPPAHGGCDCGIAPG